MKRGKKTNESGIPYPASEVWQVYSTLELPELMKTMPNFLKDVVITGDGSVGTTFDLYNLPGSAYDWYKERVGVLDDEQLIKEVKLIGGGVLDFGYISFRTRFEIIDEGPNQCTVKSTVMYEIEDQFGANEWMASVDDMGTVAQAVEQYIGKKSGGSGCVSLPNGNNNGLPG